MKIFIVRSDRHIYAAFVSEKDANDYIAWTGSGSLRVESIVLVEKWTP